MKSKTMKKCLVCLFVMFGLVSHAQVNLVLNPSFEEYDTCPTDQGQVYRAKHWNSFGNSPDYFNSCVPPIEFSTPHNILGWQMPKSGNAYVGGGFFGSHDTLTTSTVREFIGTTLNEPLTIGEKYYVSFYISVSDSPNANTVVHNKMGALFSIRSFAIDSFCPAPCEISLLLPSNHAHVYTDSIIDDMVNWVKIEGSFIADSTYEHVIIGNFFTNDNVSVVPIPSRPPTPSEGSYYYIDDIYVGVDSLSTSGTVITQRNGILIYPNPAKDIINVSLPVFASRLKIYDLMGSEIFCSELYNRQIAIDISHFHRGIYFLEARTKNEFHIAKFLIQK